LQVGFAHKKQIYKPRKANLSRGLILTGFAEKKSAIETVTPMMEKDGQWRVSGYFIR
jgi:hypothetical protein